MMDEVIAGGGLSKSYSIKAVLTFYLLFLNKKTQR